MSANQTSPYYCDECSRGEHSTPDERAPDTYTCACCRMRLNPGDTYLDDTGKKVTA
jgi:hypothetical protein